MISMNLISSAGGAAKYYTEQAAIEYYTNQAVPSTWGGKGAALDGLTGEVSAEALTSLLAGKVQETIVGKDGVEEVHSVQLGRTGIDKETGEKSILHRAGWDLTFAPPKSASIEAEVFGRQEVRDAHEQAVKTAMGYLEDNAAQTRVNGQMVATGNLVYASFPHATSRAGDPHTHTHVLIANVTYYEGRGYSLSNEQLLQQRTTADAVYKNDLANRLQQLGYELEYDGRGNFEIAGYSKDNLNEFSKRSGEIDSALQERNSSKDTASYESRQIATLATRDDKAAGHSESAEAHRERWQAEALAAGIAPVRTAQQLDAVPAMPGARELVGSAVESLAEREQEFSKKDLVKEAMLQSSGRVSSAALLSEILAQEKSGALVRRDPDRAGARFTTEAAIAGELWADKQISLGREGHVEVMNVREFEVALKTFEARKEAESLNAAKTRFEQSWTIYKLAERVGGLSVVRLEEHRQEFVEAANAFDGRTEFKLKDEQRLAARNILTGTEQFSAVQGDAGTGKTTLLEFVREAAESKGWTVQGMSNGAVQAAKLEAESGIKSTTAASFLASRKPDQDIGQSKTLFVNDEASMSGQKEFNGMIQAARDAGAKMVFVGDRGQHQSVPAGGAYERAISGDKMHVSYLQEISRQKTEQARAPVRSIIAGNHADAIRQTAREYSGAQYEVKQRWEQVAAKQRDKLTSGQTNLKRDELKAAKLEDNQTAIIALSKDYVALTFDERDNTAIITATNADRQAINEAVRRELQGQGELSGGQMEETLKAKDMTASQAAQASSYENGDVLKQTLSDGQTFYMAVAKIDAQKNIVTLDGARGRTVEISGKEAARMTAYTTQTREFAAGDRVAFFENWKEAGIKNGESGTVEKIAGTRMVVNIGGKSKEIDLKAYRQLDHGYVMTSFKAQGQTVDRTMVHHNTEAGMHGQREAYVNGTRARFFTRTYTQDREKAGEQAAKAVNKTTATRRRAGHKEEGKEVGKGAVRMRETAQTGTIKPEYDLSFTPTRYDDVRAVQPDRTRRLTPQQENAATQQQMPHKQQSQTPKEKAVEREQKRGFEMGH